MKSLVEKFLENSHRSYLRDSLLNQATNKKHLIYFTIVDDLQKLYPNVTDIELQRLAFVNYSYFRGVLLMDSIADSDADNPGKAMFDAIGFIEASIQELAWLIDSENIFWSKYTQSKMQYTRAVMLEKNITKQHHTINKDLFEIIYEGKSATLAYNLIDALDAVNKQADTELAKPLKLLLKHIHLAYQFKDDIDDFKSDLAKSQYTYAVHLVDSSLHLLKQHANDDLKYRYLFTSGIAETLLCESFQHFSQALTLAEQFGLSMFISHIKSELRSCAAQISEINALIDKTKIKLSKSSIPLSTGASDFLEEKLNLSIETATGYLLQNLNASGLWEDFLTSAGMSNYWVTAYTHYNLARHSVNSSSIKTFQGSFNETLGHDGDTLNFTIGGLGLTKMENHHTTLENYLVQWLKFRQKDGGWATYIDEPMLRSRLNLSAEISLAGWTSSQPCVSATACHILSAFPDLKKEKTATEQYLIERQHAEGFWESYWWTSDIYATSWALQALHKSSQYSACCEKALSWLMSIQNHTDGFWCDDHTNLPSPFYTALAVQAILTMKRKPDDAVRSIQWLLKQQKKDGSWPSSRILAIPATNILHRKEVISWRNSSFGVNTLVDDHNRIFTTVTALSALLTWQTIHA